MLVLFLWLLFQYNDLTKKKKIVENDKKKIEEVIQELDMKKNEALQKAWEQVNKVSLLFAHQVFRMGAAWKAISFPAGLIYCDSKLTPN